MNNKLPENQEFKSLELRLFQSSHCNLEFSTTMDEPVVYGVSTELPSPLTIKLVHNTSNSSFHFNGTIDDGYYFWVCDENGRAEASHPLADPVFITMTIISIAGIVANVVGIVSLLMNHRISKRDCTRSRVCLLISLSASDILLCTCVPLRMYVEYAMTKTSIMCSAPLVYSCTSTFLKNLPPAAQSLSLLNLLGMAVDHWITFTKPFKYAQIMNRRRTLGMIACIWLISIVMVSAEYLSGLGKLSTEQASSDYCSMVHLDSTFSPDYILMTLAPICLIAMILIYCAIYREINKLVVSAPPYQPDFGQARRALYTTLVILATFLICWFPVHILTMVLTLSTYLARRNIWIPSYYTDENKLIALLKASQWLYVLLMANAILDPVIYMSYFRLRFTAFCYALKEKLYSSRYAAADRDDFDTNGRLEVQPTQTARSSVQLSAASTQPNPNQPMLDNVKINLNNNSMGSWTQSDDSKSPFNSLNNPPDTTKCQSNNGCFLMN